MVKNTEIKPMLTVTDVAQLINVHRNTVRRWSNQGILRTYRVGPRGVRRFRIEDISDFLQQNNKHSRKGDE